MTEFLDGPAKGVKLMLRRAPHFLRAVRSEAGEWDALDQLNDAPRLGEQVFAYEMVGEPSWMHIRARNGGGIFRGGTYKLVEPQPSESVLRSTTGWQTWARERFDRVSNTPEQS